MRAIGAAVFAWSVSAAALAASPPNGDWPTYGHDKGAQRHSPLKDITPANVNQLQPAWIYHMKPAGYDAAPAGSAAPGAIRPKFLASEMTPLVAKGHMFIITPYGYIVSLDPTTGKEQWVTPIGGTPQVLPTRGVEYWPGDKNTAPRVVFGSPDGRLVELDAATGAFVKSFGAGGSVDLRTPEVMNGMPEARYDMTSPPLVVGDLVITGSRVQERPLWGPSGDVRAWDVRTGKLVWTFHTIPRPGEPNYGTWAPGAADKRSGTNVWGFISADVTRGIVYLPVAGATYDRYGGDRPGNGLYTSSLVAVSAKTGKYLWHFQLTHHDIWDYDTQSAPLLFDARMGGKAIPAVAVTNKTGFMFIFNRLTGKPLFPIAESPVPKSDTPGEASSPTQPIPSVIPPLARNSFSYPDDLVDVSPELKAWCQDFYTSNKMSGTVPYEPHHVDRKAVHFPGTEGGPDWDGESFDPKTGYIVLPVNNLGIAVQLVKQTTGQMAYTDNQQYFREPDSRDGCVKPPWASLVAVNSSTGRIAWSVPLGVTDHLPEAVRNTGRPGHGGAITTDSGLAFIGFSDDQRFHAFDTRTGKELWSYRLEANAIDTPMTYRGADGRQYVAIASTGGSYVVTPITSDTLTAFALPK